MAVGVTGSWEVIPVTVDSGAVDTVGPKTVARNFPTRETDDSRLGRNFRAANGSRINNYGEKVIQGRTK